MSTSVVLKSPQSVSFKGLLVQAVDPESGKSECQLGPSMMMIVMRQVVLVLMSHALSISDRQFLRGQRTQNHRQLLLRDPFGQQVCVAPVTHSPFHVSLQLQKQKVRHPSVERPQERVRLGDLPRHRGAEVRHLLSRPHFVGEPKRVAHSKLRHRQ